jgi:hypothetical protein
MMANEPVAHISEDGRQHTLCDHLKGTAEKAGEMAGEFGGLVLIVGGSK